MTDDAYNGALGRICEIIARQEPEVRDRLLAAMASLNMIDEDERNKVLDALALMFQAVDEAAA